ncbi:LLM class flavin-dependent oxidoreductase [Nocardioides flavescens]|uniref:LLM class flavin-dependent oxidoreductase n=1 Tax=Nocardioides flavescens TaxID=2691959 RepID=A0A6L7F210_9ACTN|nr:LLM class flavin-dependent oxidoreductase [Nocardioides flavescens]
MVSTGVVFRPQSPPEELRGAVAATEAAGVGQLWLWEDCFLEGGLTTAALALAWSERIMVGLGLMPVPLRNPALAAMEVATLARTFPGRFIPVLGHGVQPWMQQVGAAVDSPMTLLREHASAVRALLRGERVSTSGRYVSLDDVALDWPPATAPALLLGARGPRSVALAGEVADGVLLDSVADAAAVRRAREAVGPDREVRVFAEVSPTTTRSEADELVASLAEAGADAVLLQGGGGRPDVRPLLELLAG